MRNELEILRRYGLRLSKNLGQHILIDSSVIERQIEAAALTKNDTVLEIGAGIGTLTAHIAERAKKVIAIEADIGMCNALSDIMSLHSNVEIVHGDALKIDFPKFNKIVSNLPYNISSEITFKILEYDFDSAVLMYQKEFAERMVARTGKNYSRLSVNVYYRADCRIIFDVPKTAFYPQPDVDSAVVLLKQLKKPRFHVQDEKIFQTVTEHLFQHRRKKIRTSLKMRWAQALNDYRLKDFLDKRVEELTPEDIGRISDILADY